MCTWPRKRWGVLGLLVLAAAVAASAQESGANSFPVAILNLDVLFKDHAQIKAAVDDLKQEAAEIDEKVKLRQSELEAVANDLRQAQPGSQEQRRLQQEAGKLNAELQQFVARRFDHCVLAVAEEGEVVFRGPAQEVLCLGHASRVHRHGAGGQFVGRGQHALAHRLPVVDGLAHVAERRGDAAPHVLERIGVDHAVDLEMHEGLGARAIRLASR